MKAVLVSRRFNPGHMSHLLASAEMLEKHGYEVSFIQNPDFLKISSDFDGFQQIGRNECLGLRRGDLVLIWFPSIGALWDAIVVRVFTPAKLIYVFHEPYVSFVSYLNAGFGYLKTTKISFIALVNFLICFLSNKVILPSTKAFSSLSRARLNPKKYAKLNLMFKDEAGNGAGIGDRTVVSYIGTIAEDHAFDTFLDLISECIESAQLEGFSFLIASRSVLPSVYEDRINACLRSGRLRVVLGKPLTNEEINLFYGGSYLIWNAYRRSMQSGVLPKAYMFGTPVIVSLSNQSEYFEPDVHGICISDSCSLDEFVSSIERIKEGWSDLSRNCRIAYMKNFDYNSLSDNFFDFVNSEG